jgi:hypothetical protein
MDAKLFLLLNLALGFYNAGTIWAHEVDIFRSWRLVGRDVFPRVQAGHWHKLPYWVFIPVGLALVGSIALIWFHPSACPKWGIGGAVACQSLSIILTAAFWGRWQARLAADALGSDSLYLAKILKTHWIRTALINASAIFLLCAMAGSQL